MRQKETIPERERGELSSRILFTLPRDGGGVEDLTELTLCNRVRVVISHYVIFFFFFFKKKMGIWITENEIYLWGKGLGGRS